MRVASLSGLSRNYCIFEGRAVIDETGLHGQFHIHFECGPDVPGQSDTAAATTGVASDPSPGAASFLVALREQLGLELKSGRTLLAIAGQ
jgi:uncharacterized protein (TIGR03435 family)